MSEHDETSEEFEALAERPGDRVGSLALTIVVLVASGDLVDIDDLLCSLEGQTSQDFDVMLVCERALAAELEAHVAQFAGGVADRLVVLEPDERSSHSAGHPSRAAALLRRAVDGALGRHVVVADADVIFFGDFVERFAAVGMRSPDAVLRSVGAEQQFARCAWPDGSSGYAAISAPETPWAESFDAVLELWTPQSPLGTFAISRDALRNALFSFLEPEQRAWDWELFFRAATQYGVADLGAVTTLRRRWAERDEQRAVELVRSRRELGSRLDAISLTVPPGHVSAIQRLVESERDLAMRLQELEAERAAWRELEPSSLPSPVAVEQLRALEAELRSLRASTSWRVTAPLRMVGSWWRRRA